MYRIMEDAGEYEGVLYPIFIVGKNKELLPVFIGKSDESKYSIWVDDESFEKLNRNNIYILIHLPKKCMSGMKELIDKYYDVQKTDDFDHVHITMTNESKPIDIVMQ